jgi:hypothetical protein
MYPELTQLIDRNDTLRAQVAQARVRLAEAYAPRTVAPREVASASFLAARAEAERATGCTLIKFFAPDPDGEGAP